MYNCRCPNSYLMYLLLLQRSRVSTVVLDIFWENWKKSRRGKSQDHKHHQSSRICFPKMQSLEILCPNIQDCCIFYRFYAQINSTEQIPRQFLREIHYFPKNWEKKPEELFSKFKGKFHETSIFRQILQPLLALKMSEQPTCSNLIHPPHA